MHDDIESTTNTALRAGRQKRRPWAICFALLLAAAACSTENAASTEPDASPQDGGAVTDDPDEREVTPEAGLAPVDAPATAAELSHPTDLAALLARMGFAPGWPSPEAIETDPALPATIRGVQIHRAPLIDGGVRLTEELAFEIDQTGDLEAIANEWFAQLKEAFGLTLAPASSHFTNDTHESFSIGDLGDDSTPEGEFHVEAVREIGTDGPATVIIKHRRSLPGTDLGVAFPADVEAQLPDIATCEQEQVFVEYDDFRAVNDLPDEAEYLLRTDFRCAPDAVDSAEQAMVTFANAYGADIGPESASDIYAEVTGLGDWTVEIQWIRTDENIGLGSLSLRMPLD